MEKESAQSINNNDDFLTSIVINNKNHCSKLVYKNCKVENETNKKSMYLC